MKRKKIVVLILLAVILLMFLSSWYSNRVDVIIKKLTVDSSDKKQIELFINYGIIPVGTVIFKNEGFISFEGDKVIHLNAYAKLNAFVDKFFNVVASADSYVNDKGLPVKFYQEIRIPEKEPDVKEILFDHNEKIMTIEGKQRTIVDSTHDPLSLLFTLLKDVDFSSGKEFSANINTNQKNYMVSLTPVEKSQHKIRSTNFDVWKVKGNIRRRNKTKIHSTKFIMFFMEKPYKVPVFIKVFSNIGTVKVRLKSINTDFIN